jgi:glycolate oxidase
MRSAISENILSSIADDLTTVCGRPYVITDKALHTDYESDQTLNLRFPFDVLVKPGTAAEVAAVMKICHRYRIPVTPRGAGSGVTGGALPLKEGVVLSLERLNRILELQETDGYILAESGVITGDVCTYVADRGFCFPVAPGSSQYSFIGGNVAENAGSIHSCKYGCTADYVLNLEVVLPNGDLIWTGANVAKNVTGFNLTRLFAGSEGTLGIITKVVYRLLRKPAATASLLAIFDTVDEACAAVISVKRSGLLPSAAELMGTRAIQITEKHLHDSLLLAQQPYGPRLLIGLEADSEAELFRQMEHMEQLLSAFTTGNILVATTTDQIAKLWQVRSHIGAALTSNYGRYRDIDVCVPLSRLPSYIRQLEAISNQYEVPLIYFGHALDGNLHTMLLLSQEENEEESRFKQAVQAIYAYAVSIGGVLSGEHGIGMLQKEFLSLQFSPVHLQLMQGLKNVFDPEGVLNPGKIL